MATISEVLKTKTEDDEEEPKKKSREDWRKAKELEEARKAGTAPAAVDEEGKDINPHIPQYISSAPWYYGTSGPTLKHQRVPEKSQEYSSLNEWYKRGVNTESVSTKFRKGACENCGAMTHKKKDCFERPRKVGAIHNSINIAPDEHVQPELNQDFDGKRDRWAGYDPSQHKAIIEQYQKIEEAKRDLRAQKLNADEKGEGNSSADENDEDKYVDDFDMPGTKVDSKQRITVRNLRIREDTAKYLRNLDLSSAYYDPKTRSMRDNPHKPGEDPEQVEYAGENFVRFSGDTTKHAQAQLFAWEAYERGVDVHLLAEPTKLEQLKKEYETHKDRFKKKTQNTVLAKYGGEEHLETPPVQLLLAQTEEYIEYSRRGDIIKGEEKGIVRSRYEEDVYPSNHTSVWGSYWEAGEWGYKCCRSLIQNSYCTGKSGVALSTNVPELGKIVPVVENTVPESISLFKDKVTKDESITSHHSSSASSSASDSSDSEALKEKSKKKKKKKKKKKMMKKKAKKEEVKDALKKALEKEEERLKEVDRVMNMDERKRPYNSMYEVSKPTDEEIEAYHMKKRREDDPMSNFV
ncbi:hypothetical protein ACI65C_001861 [Semiaphis heraclei]